MLIAYELRNSEFQWTKRIINGSARNSLPEYEAKRAKAQTNWPSNEQVGN